MINSIPGNILKIGDLKVSITISTAIKEIIKTIIIDKNLLSEKVGFDL